MVNHDPAIEAARRAKVRRPLASSVAQIDAAREALAPIRALHKPIAKHFHGLLGDRTVCEHCYHPTVLGGAFWPCPTALLAYTTEELEA